MKNNLYINSDQTVIYNYRDSERDELTIELRPMRGTTKSETVPTHPHVTLYREEASGEVVNLTVTSVQQLILENLVRVIVTELQDYFQPRPSAAPTAMVEPTAPTVEPLDFAAELQAAESDVRAELSEGMVAPAPELVLPDEQTAALEEQPIDGGAQAPEPTPDGMPLEMAFTSPVEDVAQTDGEAQSASQAETAPADTLVPEIVEAEAAPKKSRSSRRRKKPVEPVAEEQSAPSDAATETSSENLIEAAITAEGGVTPEGETPAPKPKRSRSSRRKPKGEPSAADVETGAPLISMPNGDIVEDRPISTEVILESETGLSLTTDEIAPDAIADEPQPVVETSNASEPLEGEEGATAENASGETEEKKGRRKRRNKRNRTEIHPVPPTLPTAAQLTEAPAPPAQSQTGREERTSPPRDSRRAEPEEAEDSSDRGRSAYKTAPIPGLGAPEEFASLNINDLLGQALMAMGFESPTPIQRRAIPEAMTGKDIIGLAQTGTGKTMAFLIPALQRMLDDPTRLPRLRMVVLTPTRELAAQVSIEAEHLATHTDFNITTVYGGTDMRHQIRELKLGTDILVATPGRLLDHIKRGNVRLDTVEFVVLDEADRMLDMGFIPDVREILRSVPRNRQTMLFSATMPPAIQSLSAEFQREPVVMEVARQLPPSQIDQRLYPIEKHLKMPLLVHLLKNDPAMRSVLIFTETKSEADFVYRRLREQNQPIALMHGDRHQKERERALDALRSGRVRALVATNVAARGLDIHDITHVINYDIPQTVDDYVHRIGRTARGEAAEGTAISLVTSADEIMITRIESALERTLPREKAEGFEYAVPTPSWAKRSADEITAELTKPRSLADRLGRMLRRR